MFDMRQTAPIRQAIVAEQIKEALATRGLSKKQFADLMHRSPSEVTKWISGKHNFTISLLQEISEVLEVNITGVEDIETLIDGYEHSDKQHTLTDYAAIYGSGFDLYTKIRRRSLSLGISAKQYIEKLVDEEILNSVTLPRVKSVPSPSKAIEKFAGIIKAQPSQNDLDNDERLSRIWNR